MISRHMDDTIRRLVHYGAPKVSCLQRVGLVKKYLLVSKQCHYIAQAFILTVILACSLDLGLQNSNFQIVEFFAGQRRICRLARNTGLKVAAHDILYDTAATSQEISSLNINRDSGFLSGAWLLGAWAVLCDIGKLMQVLKLLWFYTSRLAISTIMFAAPGDLLCTLGICCSTWVSINAGTSGRDDLMPMGREHYRSVAASNQMVSR